MNIKSCSSVKSNHSCNLDKCSRACHFCMDGFEKSDGAYNHHLRRKLHCEYLFSSRIRTYINNPCANSKSPLLLFLYWWSLDGCKLRIHSIRLDIHDSLYVTVRAMNLLYSLRTLRLAAALSRWSYILTIHRPSDYCLIRFGHACAHTYSVRPSRSMLSTLFLNSRSYRDGKSNYMEGLM